MKSDWLEVDNLLQMKDAYWSLKYVVCELNGLAISQEQKVTDIYYQKSAVKQKSKYEKNAPS